MCGLFGFSGQGPVDETKLRWLAIENNSRGRDATGVYGAHLYKDNVSSEIFIQSKGWEAAVKNAKTIGGHTRAASHGSRVQANAHPFAYGANTENYCVGAHNGFLLPQMLKHYGELYNPDGGKEFAVDSMAIFAALSKSGDWKVISELDGGMAIWFLFPNKDAHTIYLYKRTRTRDLYFGQAKEGLYFSSEEKPLKLIGCKATWEAPEDYLISVRKGEIISLDPMPSPKIKSLSNNPNRSTWEGSVPDAEIRALPEAVASEILKAKSATGTPKIYDVTDQSNWGWRGGNNNRNNTPWNSSSTPSKKEKLAKEAKDTLLAGISTKDSQWETKITDEFIMTLKTIKEEIINVRSLQILEPAMSAIMPQTYYTGCMFIFRLLSKSNDVPLSAWSLIPKDSENFDMCSLSGINGIGAIKIPAHLCKKPIVFQVYGPIDGVGPYEFTLLPEKERVQEVTLYISFCEKGQEQNSTDERGERSYPSSRLGSNGGTMGVLVPPTAPVLEQITDEAGRLLPGKDAAVCITPTIMFTHDQAVKALPKESEQKYLPITSLSAGYKEKIKQSIPYLEEPQRSNMVNYITKRNARGSYDKATWEPAAEAQTFMKNFTHVLLWGFLYEKVLPNLGAGQRLVGDALRVLAYDKSSLGLHLKLPVYIKMVMECFPGRYLSHNDWLHHYDSATNSEMNILSEHVLPDTIIKKFKDSVYETKPMPPVAKRMTSEVFYETYMELMQKTESMKYMTAPELTSFGAELKELKTSLSTIVGEAREALRNDADNPVSTDTTELRDALQKARRFLVSELEDLEMLESKLNTQLSQLDGRI